MTPIVKRIIVGIVGGLVTLVGVVALVAPGPGWLIIFTGLGILATEFAWAARVLTSAKKAASRAANKAKIKKKHQLMIIAELTFLSLVLLIIWYEYTFKFATFTFCFANLAVCRLKSRSQLMANPKRFQVIKSQLTFFRSYLMLWFAGSMANYEIYGVI